jgi:hypothetical protein
MSRNKGKIISIRQLLFIRSKEVPRCGINIRIRVGPISRAFSHPGRHIDRDDSLRSARKHHNELHWLDKGNIYANLVGVSTGPPPVLSDAMESLSDSAEFVSIL